MPAKKSAKPRAKPRANTGLSLLSIQELQHIARSYRSTDASLKGFYSWKKARLVAYLKRKRYYKPRPQTKLEIWGKANNRSISYPRTRAGARGYCDHRPPCKGKFKTAYVNRFGRPCCQSMAIRPGQVEMSVIPDPYGKVPWPAFVPYVAPTRQAPARRAWPGIPAGVNNPGPV